MGNLHSFFFKADHCYSVDGSFEQATELLQTFSKSPAYPELSTDLSILVIETREGVFIRSQSPVWITVLDSLTNDPTAEPYLKSISLKDWEANTRKNRAPLNSFGDEKLAMWKVGF